MDSMVCRRKFGSQTSNNIDVRRVRAEKGRRKKVGEEKESEEIKAKFLRFPWH